MVGKCSQFAFDLRYLLIQRNFKAMLNILGLCNVRPPSEISASNVYFQNFGRLFPLRNESIIAWMSINVCSGGVGRDRGICVFFKYIKDFMITALPYGVRFLIFHINTSFFHI